MSHRIDVESWSSSSDRTWVLGDMLPPRESRYEARALAIDWEPPAVMGHPAACPAMTKGQAMAEVNRSSSGMIECAAIPANKARAFGVLKSVRAARVAG